MRFELQRHMAWACMFLVALVAISPAQKKPRQGSENPEARRQEIPFTFQVPVDVVVVHVTVLDRQGNPVRNLTADDFKVYDDGRPQTFHTFATEFYKAAKETPPPESPSVEAATEGSESPRANQPRYLCFFIDDLVQPSIELYHPAMEAVRAFVAHDLERGDQVTLVAASGLVRYPFSSDAATLLGQAEEMETKLNRRQISLPTCPQMSDLQAARIVDRMGAIVPENSEYADEDAVRVAATEMLTCNANVRLVYELQGRAAAVAEAKRLLPPIAQQYTQEKEYRIGSTLTSLRQYIASLRFYKGRKSLMLLSGGFYSSDTQYLLQEVVDRALRSGVTINSIDIRGAYTTNIPAADAVIADSSTMGQRTLLHMASIQAREEPLAQMAADTGGMFAHGSNDLHAGIRKIAERDAYSYILSYALSSMKSDGRFHKIRVEVDRPGVQINCRQGYYAPKEEISFLRRKRGDILEALRAPGDISNIPVHFSYSSFQLDDAHYQLSIQVQVDIHSIKFVELDARYRNLIHIVTVASDAQGRVVDGLEKAIDFKLTDSSYRDMLKHGLSAQADITLPPGRYKLQAVVRESNEAGMGSQSKFIEVP